MCVLERIWQLTGMETHQSNQEGALFYDAEAKPFRLLSIYDSEEAGREAIQASDLVLRELGDTIEADRTTWDIDSLDEDAIRTLAAEEAARADVIVIALAADKSSETLKDWVKEWQCNREVSGGLLALISASDSETRGDLADFLYETAVTANMDFLCQRKRRG